MPEDTEGQEPDAAGPTAPEERPEKEAPGPKDEEASGEDSIIDPDTGETMSEAEALADTTPAPRTSLYSAEETAQMRGSPSPPMSLTVKKTNLSNSYKFACQAADMRDDATLKKCVEEMAVKFPWAEQPDLAAGPHFEGTRDHDAAVALFEDLKGRLDDWLIAAYERVAELHGEELARRYPHVPEQNREIFNIVERWKMVVERFRWSVSLSPRTLLFERLSVENGGIDGREYPALDLRAILGETGYDRLRQAESKLDQESSVDREHGVEMLLHAIEDVQAWLIGEPRSAKDAEPGAPPAPAAPEAAEEVKGKLDQVASRVDGLERRESLSYDFKSFGEITLREAGLVVGWEHTEANRRKLSRKLFDCLVKERSGKKRLGKDGTNLYYAWKAAKVFQEEKIAAQWSRLALARCPEKVSQAKALDEDEKLTLESFLERKLKDHVVDEDKFQGVRDERDLDRIRSNIIEFFTDRMLMAQDKLELTWSNLDRIWDLAEADALDLWRRQLRVLDASADEQPPGGTADPAAPDDEDSPHG